MFWQPPRATRYETLLPYSTLFRAGVFVARQFLDVEHGISLAVRHGFLELLVAALALAVGADLLELDLIAGQRIVGARRVDHVRGHGDDEIGHRLTLQRLAVDPHDAAAPQIGRASCRERVCQDV